MSDRNRLLGCLLVAFGVVCGLWASADQANQADKTNPSAKAGKEPAKPAAESKDSAKPTHRVEKSLFKIEVALKGVVESEDVTEVALRLEEGSSPLVVRKAVEHGATAQKGDTLVWPNLDKIDHTIRDLEADQYLSELAIRLAEEDVAALSKSTPLDLAAAERTKKIADEDLKKWVEVDRAFTEKRAHHNAKQARQMLENQKEELRQLEKMYKADDLTEETEEIILKRQRNAVEAAEFYLKSAELDRDRMLKVELPRRDHDLREGAVKQGLSLDKARATFPLTLNQKRLSLDKLKYDRVKANERLAKLKRDRDAMTIKAPADGIVYYGKFVRGQWSGAATVAAKLQRGGTIAADEVIITLVNPQKMFVRAVIEEADLHHFRADLPGKVQVTARPDVKLSGRLDRYSRAPVEPGKFEGRIRLSPRKDNDALMPGMACTVKLVPYLKEQALTAPVAAVFSEERDEDQHFVYVLGKDRKAEKRPVTVGKKTDKRAEILTGLEEGDQVFLEKPEEIKLAAAPGKAGAK